MAGALLEPTGEQGARSTGQPEHLGTQLRTHLSKPSLMLEHQERREAPPKGRGGGGG